MAWKFSKIAAVSVFVTIALWLAYYSNDKLYHKRPEPEPQVPIPRYEAWGLRDLKDVIQVSTIHIQLESSDSFEPPLRQDVDISIPFSDVDVREQIPELSTETTTVKIRTPKVPDASSLVIGLATTLQRLRDALPAFAIWASGTKARFIVVVKPQEPEGLTLADITQLYQEHDILLTLVESPADWYDQYVSLLSVLHDHADPTTTKWACIMDDDTFFFSMTRILAMLDRYNPSLPYYIGGLSENKETMDRLGYLAYGGAGVFFSMALLRDLRPHVDACIAMPDPAGDIRISSCIYTYTETKFTWEHHLFQMDLHGDVTGFYEAVRTIPLSTHHWKTWHFHDMVTVGAVSRACGNECILQKFSFADGHLMTNGFSIVRYSYTEQETRNWIDAAMEHTWADTAWVIPTSWNYTLAPLRPKDQGKVQYLIERVDDEENGKRLVLYYVRRNQGLGEAVIRVVWERLL